MAKASAHVEAIQQVLEHDKEYEDIAERRGFQYPDIDRALGLVRAWLVKRQRILYGGMAIDLNLKGAGHAGIYKADAIPDYDFMSPTMFEDSLEIADMLMAEGFENVSAINAMHVTTRRVRVNFASVADITYIPPVIYDAIPTKMADGLRIVHADFIRMDMHRAMNTPLEKPPGEVIAQRIRKDYKRWQLLHQYCPLEVHPLVPGPLTQTVAVPLTWLKGAVISGLATYAVLYTALMAMGGAADGDLYPVRALFKADTLELLVPELGEPVPVSIITDDWEELLTKVLQHPDFRNVKPRYFNSYLDNLRRRTVLLEGKNYHLQIMDNYGVLQPAWSVTGLLEAVNGLAKGKTIPSAGDWKDVWVTGAPEILIYTLQRGFECAEVPVKGGSTKIKKADKVGKLSKAEKVKKVGKVGKLSKAEKVKKVDTVGKVDKLSKIGKVRDLSASSLDKISKAEKVIIIQQYIEIGKIHHLGKIRGSAEKAKPVSDSRSNFWRALYLQTVTMVGLAEDLVSESEAAQKIYSRLPYFLGVQTYGKRNWSPDYIGLVMENYYRDQRTPAAERKFTRPQFGYYPDHKAPRPSFDPASTELFLMDGQERTTPFETLSLPGSTPVDDA